MDYSPVREQPAHSVASDRTLRHVGIGAAYVVVAAILEFVGRCPSVPSGELALRPILALSALLIIVMGWWYAPLVVGCVVLSSWRTPVLGANLGYVALDSLIACGVIFGTGYLLRRTWDRGKWGSQFDFVVLGVCAAVFTLAIAANDATFSRVETKTNPFLLAWLAAVIPLGTMLPAGIKLADWYYLPNRPTLLSYLTEGVRPGIMSMQYASIVAFAGLNWLQTTWGGTGRVFPMLIATFWVAVTSGLAGATMAALLAQTLVCALTPPDAEFFSKELSATVMAGAAIVAGGLVTARKAAEAGLVKQGEALRRQLAEMQVIRRLADSIIALRDASDLYRQGAQAIGEQLEADQITLLWVDANGIAEERGTWSRNIQVDRERFRPDFCTSQMSPIWRELESTRRTLLSRADLPHPLLVSNKLDVVLHQTSGTKSLILHPFSFDGVGFQVAAIAVDGRFRNWTSEELQFVAAATDQITIAQQKSELLLERDERSRAFTRMTQALVGDTGEAFFRNLVLRLAEAAGTRGAYCSRLVSQSRATMLAFADGGRSRPSFEFDLADTPIPVTFARGSQAFDDGAGEAYPKLDQVVGFAVRGFTSIALVNSQGESLGSLAVCDDKPLADSEHVASVLRLFAARASAEIERSEREKLLRENEASLRRLLETAHEGILTVDAGGSITYGNPTIAALLGYSTDELIGSRFQDFITEQDRDRVSQELQRELAGVAAQQDIRLRRRDGTFVWTMISISPIRDEDGDFHGGLAMITDISQRKQNEQTLDRLVQDRTAELVASNGELEAFCYSVSHDLRQPLRAIDGFSRAAIEDLGDQIPDDVRDHLQRVRRASTRMSELIDALLSLSRLGRIEMKREDVDLSEIAESVAADLTRGDPEKARCFVVEKGLRTVGDARLLHIVLENLMSNAWKFSSRSSEPRVEVGLQRFGDRSAFFVRDNGIGFNMSYQSKLFLPFERLHSQTEFAGTGIGLATVKRIIERHGGKVWAEGEEGKGATFYFEL